MSFANVYVEPIKPKVGRYLQPIHGDGLWKIRHIGHKTKIITGVRQPGCVLKIHEKYLDQHFTIRIIS
jgi:hypothetical protein